MSIALKFKLIFSLRQILLIKIVLKYHDNIQHPRYNNLLILNVY